MATEVPMETHATVLSTPASPGVVEETRVLLHQFPRSSAGPSASLFALKLETYFRIAKINYENEFAKPSSPKTGKTPWMSYNGVEVTDSTLCIEYAKTKTGIDFNANLNNADRGVSLAFQKLMEEELYWVLTLWRWVFDKEESLAKIMSFGKVKGFFVTKFIRSGVKKSAHGHGIGRHSPEEVMTMGEKDITAIGEFLGSKKYFMGDFITDIDCTAFGLFAQFLYFSQTCPLTNFIKEKYPNIVEYCDRIKAEYWSDWETICQTVKSEKEARKSVKSPTVETHNATVVNGNGTLNGHGHCNSHTETTNVTVVEPTVLVAENGHSEVKITTTTTTRDIAPPVQFAEDLTVTKSVLVTKELDLAAPHIPALNGQHFEEVVIKENGHAGDVQQQVVPAV